MTRRASGLRCRYQATAFLTSAVAPLWYSTRSALIHHGQEFAMQFFPRDGHRLARFEVCDSTCHLRIPSLLERDRFVGTLKRVEQRVG